MRTNDSPSETETLHTMSETKSPASAALGVDALRHEPAYVLAFDTANEVIAIGVGVLHEEARAIELVAHAEIEARRQSNTQLIPRIDALLAERGIARGDIACVCVGRGPGSFTGGRTPTANNRKQAMVPTKGHKLPNAHGTAPGAWFEDDGCIAVLMPGVPREMKAMWAEDIRPVLLQRQNCTIHSKTLRVLGGESSIASKVSPLFASENPTAAIYCKIGESEIRVTARAATEAEAETACDARIAEFRKILGPNAYDVDVPGLEYTVVHLLQQKGLHAATAESCTGGLVAEKITNVPGSSEVFGYGFVTYAEAAKAKLLGVDPTLIEQYNVVSGPVAVAMAYGALQASGADLAVGITGIAGPGGALPGKPVGTVYLAGADARSGKAWLMRLELGGYAERSIIRTRAALYALDLLRRMALDIPPENAHPVPSKDVKPETLDI